MEHIVEKKPYSEYVKMSEEALEKVNNFVEEAKEYTDSVKDDLLNGAGDAYDTLKELGDLIENNVDSIEALREIASGKADKVHSHVASNITDLQEKLNSTKNDAVSSAKTYTDTKITESETKTNQALANKLDIRNEKSIVYVNDSKGTSTYKFVSSAIIANAVVARDGNGNFKVNAPIGDENPTPKEYVDTKKAEAIAHADALNSALEERVADLESLTLTFTEDKTTAYEKSVPANIGKYALIKGIGGATERVRKSKNLINPADIQLPEQFDSYTINQDGTITYTINHPQGFAFIMLTDLPVGRYYFYVDGICDGEWNFYDTVDEQYIEMYVMSDFDDSLNDYLETTRTLKVMLWRDESVTTDALEIVEAPEGTVFEPYHEPYLHDVDVEKIESIGVDGTTSLDSFILPEAVRNLDGFGMGIDSTYNNRIEWVDDKVNFIKPCRVITLDGDEAWKENSKSGANKYFYFNITTIVEGVCLCDKYEKASLSVSNNTVGVNVATVSGSLSVLLRPENADSMSIDDFKKQLIANPVSIMVALKNPSSTDITDLFTEDNTIKVEQGGTLRFVNEREMSVPSTISYVTRKG